MEVRFFVPGGLVANLDFVESIFGNAGDPYLPSNDAALDVERWTGHSGCVILAPHLTRLQQEGPGHAARQPGAPRRSARRACAGRARPSCTTTAVPSRSPARSIDGVMVTILADNYFGYCKKEVKTQISYSANLFGLAEEEHAGGALAFATFSLGDRFVPGLVARRAARATASRRSVAAARRPRRRSTRRATPPTCVYPEIHYMPEDMEIDVKRQDITWTSRDGEQHLKLLPGTDLHPSRAATRCAWPSTRPRRAGAWSARCPRAPSATSRAPSRAAASRRSARA